MGEQDEKRASVLCVKTLLAAGGATALAFMIGFGPRPAMSLAEPALLWLAIPAGAFGVVAGRVYLGALFSPLFALAGAIGILLQGTPPESHSRALLGVFFGVGGLVCVITGAVGGLIGDLARQKR